MRGTLELFLNDMRTACRNVMSAVMLVGLVVIPMLFTWFNVLASWDPFDNTSQLKVAVASKDTGYKSDLLPVPINVGDQVLNELRANEQLDWVVTTSDEAIEGTKSGEYYAAIVLPEDFSTDMMNFYTDGSQPADLSFYMNEKKNALAPKITGQGAEGVSAQVAEAFTTTVGDVSFDLVTSLSDFLSQGDTKAVLDRMQARADGVQTQLDMAARTARSLAGLVDTAVPLMESAQRIADSADLELPEVQSSSLNVSTDALQQSLDATSASYDVVRQRIDALYDDASASRADRVAALNTLAGQVEGTIAQYQNLHGHIEALPIPVGDKEKALSRIEDAIDAERALHARLTAAANAPEPTKPDLSSLDDAKKAVEGISTSGLRESLRALQNSLGQVSADLDTAKTPVTIDSSSLTDARDAVQKLASGLQDKANKFGDLKKDIDSAAESGDLKKLADLIGSDPDALARAIAAPVDVDRQAVYPVKSFGAGMTPMYTALALWVGALLTAVSVRTDVVDKDKYSPMQRFFGRFGIFAAVGLVQSTMLILGLIFFVGIEPAHPILMLLAGWVSSLIFMLICYTFVVSFANAGKALAVLMLVIQVSSSGGAYPLPVLPEWFQNISPWLPATYTIRAFRAAIAGTYHGDFWLSLLALLLFAVPMLVLGVVFHKPLEKFTNGWVETLEKTKLM
ncbi:phage infection protein [Corynebacterium sp. HMSC062A03]|nr:phage infection protein [Corynebacterium sp. HMSC062A03]